MGNSAVQMDKPPKELTRVEAVVQAIRHRIADRSLSPGERLPSIRAMAKQAHVSSSTVVEAYDRLVAEGLIVARRGSGFFAAGPLAPLALSEIAPKLDREIDPLWVSRQSLEAQSDCLMPGCGWLPASWMPEQEIRRGLRALSRGKSAALTDYGSPLGLAPLRQLISRRLADKSVDAAPGQIMLTESGTQAIDLLCRFVLEPGDKVLVDDPCYFNFLALLKAHRATPVSVAYTPAGPDVQQLEQVLQEHKPRLYITNSAVHNPTGAVLSPVTAHQVLKLAEQHGLTIIEDEIFADFETTPAPRLAAFDGLERVIQIGSFSKTLSAAARCGFIAARPDWIEALIDLKIATSFGGGQLDAELVLHVLRDASYRKHMDRLRLRLKKSTDETSARLSELGITPLVQPQTGMFLWARLPDGLDASDLARTALDWNIILAPGNVFSLSQSAGSHMRFNVSRCADDQLFDVLRDAIAGAKQG